MQTAADWAVIIDICRCRIKDGCETKSLEYLAICFWPQINRSEARKEATTYCILVSQMGETTAHRIVLSLSLLICPSLFIFVAAELKTGVIRRHWNTYRPVLVLRISGARLERSDDVRILVLITGEKSGRNQSF